MRSMRRTAFQVAACLALAGCQATWTELADKATPAGPLSFDGAAGFGAVMRPGADLCATGQVDLVFGSADERFGYPLALAAGDEVRATTAGSEDLDTVLYVYGPDDGTGDYGDLPAAMDDDSGPGRLSALAFTVKTAGGYALIATTWQGQGKGAATLRVTVNGIAGCAAAPVTCDPSVKPTCTSNGGAVSCDLAMAWLDDHADASPRAKCVRRCAETGDPNGGRLGDDKATACAWGFQVQGLTCAGCCTLSDQPVTQAPCDDDPCTADACAGDVCTHVPHAWIGQPCSVTNDFGTCPGAYACQAGQKACSARTPALDVPNGLDDDCDGVTDVGAHACTDDAGCAKGSRCLKVVSGIDPQWVCLAPPACRTCETGAQCAWPAGDGACTGVAGATHCLYPCGTDDDCAEGYACAGTPGSCRPAGGAACPCVATAERCNGRDDDCDGGTDEDFPVGQACDGPDADVCRNGTYTCTVDGAGVECVNETVTDVVERCNGVDDDCDGQTDEDFTHLGMGLGASCHGTGACGFGVVACRLDGLGAACSTDPGGPASEATAERCNGLDDDCNGVTDDGFPGLGQPCGARGACPAARWTCAADGSGVECTTPSDPGPERCNGVDDDCDGLTDEDFPIGQACDGPDADLCRNGTSTCTPDGTGVECVNEVVTDLTDVCNGRDDDCDGLTDEGCAGDDVDGDGVAAATDNCPNVANADQADGDQDDVGDACDCDVDGDQAPNAGPGCPACGTACDNCLYVYNPDQKETVCPGMSPMGIGDACRTDLDADGVANDSDVCPCVWDPDQLDTDHDGVGDACDCDADGDGSPTPGSGAPGLAACAACGGAGQPACDCAPLDPAVHPGAAEVPGNGVDEDCDGKDG